MENDTDNTRRINPELEKIKLQRRKQTFWSGAAAAVTGTIVSFFSKQVLEERALLKWVRNRLYVNDLANIDVEPFWTNVDMKKWGLDPRIGKVVPDAEGKDWFDRFFDEKNPSEFFKTLQEGRYPLPNIKPDDRVERAFIKVCTKDSEVFNTAKAALKKEFAVYRAEYQRRTKGLYEQYENEVEALMKLGELGDHPTPAQMRHQQNILHVQETIMKEQENLRYWPSVGYKKFEDIIFRAIKKEMGLQLRHADGKGKVLWISAGAGVITTAITYSMIRLRQYFKEDQTRQAAMEKQAKAPSTVQNAVVQEDINSIEQPAPQDSQFANLIKPSATLLPKSQSESAATRIMEQRNAGSGDPNYLSL